MSDVTLPESLPPWIRDHVELYLTDGEAGHHWDASLAGGEGILTTLLLFTTGRKSGKQSILPLIYQPTGDGGFCIIASKGGAPAHPAWFLNLEAEPKVKIQVGNDTYDAVARIAEGEERQRLWDLMVSYYGPYTDYQAAAGRTIPVVVVDPV